MYRLADTPYRRATSVTGALEDFQDCVIALLHNAQLHEHGAATPATINITTGHARRAVSSIR